MRASFLPSLGLAGLGLVVGCGTRTGLGVGESAGDATVDLGVDTFVPVDVAPPVETSPECEGVAERIAAKIVPAQGSCTTVLRISRDDVLTGVHMFCAGYKTTDDATAQKQSMVDTGIGGCPIKGSYTGSKPPDDYLYFQKPSAAACACCGDGWFTAVSARNAMTLLGGAISFGAGRGLVFPSTFDPPSDYGLECVAPFPVVKTRGFDLTDEEDPSGAPPPLELSVIDPVMKVVWRTALPAALAKKHYLFDAVVLKYSADATSTVNFEWIVMLNSGWLE